MSRLKLLPKPSPLEWIVIACILLLAVLGLASLHRAALHFGGIPDPDLRVAVASSLEPVLPALERLAPGTRIDFVLGPSGRLANQLEAGAPFDAVLLAADAPMDRLAAAGSIDPATRFSLASNRLVLVAPAGSESPTGLGDLAGLRVALGEPGTVPLGGYTAEALVAAGVTSPARVVFGTSAAQVLSYVRTGEVDAAVVYATDARRADKAIRVMQEIDPALHRPIAYPAAVTTSTADAAAAAAFLDLLRTPEARAALENAGFTEPADRRSKEPETPTVRG